MVDVNLKTILNAKSTLSGVVKHTPCEKSERLSTNNDVFLKREDLQLARSYKIRGAFNYMSKIKQGNVVCSSVGNHAQGVAYACNKLGLQGIIFMPTTTPLQKISKTKQAGKENISIQLVGDTFDDACNESLAYLNKHGGNYVHPFDDAHVISGQATIAVEIFEDVKQVDYIIVPVGGGGLIAGIGTYANIMHPQTKIIGVESQDAASMTAAFEAGSPVTLDKLSTFVDGAAVKRVGDLSFTLANKCMDEIITVPEGKVSTKLIDLYREDGIVVELAGVMSIAALDYLDIENKSVVCVVSGGNNDPGRLEQIKERSLLYEGLKHYFIIDFPQRPGALKEFLSNVLGPTDDITSFEYLKKTNREFGPAFVGLQLEDKDDYGALIDKLNKERIRYTPVTKESQLYEYFV